MNRVDWLRLMLLAGVVATCACSASGTTEGTASPETVQQIQQASCSPITTCYNALATCGTPSDGCGGTLNCGSCPSGQVCTNFNCYSATCQPSTCGPTSCGCSGDGCGNSLCCGSCPVGSYCNDVACVHLCDPPNCPIPKISTSEFQPCSGGACFMGDGNVGVGFGVTPTAVGGSVSSGSRPFTWSVVGGRLPPGLTLDPSFSTMNTLLHGTPTVAGTSTFTIQVEDAAQETAQQAFSITIGTGNLDSLTITRATYNVKRVTLQVAANDPNVDSVLTVFLTGTGHQIGRLNTSGTGSYSGNFVMSLSALNPANITVKSSRGASASSPVTIVRQY